MKCSMFNSYPPADGKKFLNDRRRCGGGNTSCALAAAARLGSRCAMLGRLGDDDLSQFAREQLAATGVNVSRLLHDPAAGPISTIIVVSADSGSRAIFADTRAVMPLEPDDLCAEWFHGAKVLLVDHLYPPTIRTAVRTARQLGLQVVSDIETDMPYLAEVRDSIDHFICSAEFAIPHTGADDASAACMALSQTGQHRTVVVTAGSDGCYWCTRERPAVQHVAAHSIKPVDTTGCGDVFHGAFCHALVAGWPIAQIVRFVNAAAAIKATRTGGWSAVPCLQEIEAIMETTPH